MLEKPTQPKLIFASSLALTIAGLLILVGCGFFASVELTQQIAPKAIGGLFMFCLGMLIGIYVDKDGLRRPDVAEQRRKLPIVVGGAIVSFLVIGWLNQVNELHAQMNRYDAACKVASELTLDQKVAEAQRDAADAQMKINQLTFVRHPLMDSLPCT